MVCWGVCFFVESLAEKNNRVFKGVEKDPDEIWPSVRFRVSLWASVPNIFCNYFLGNILLS